MIKIGDASRLSGVPIITLRRWSDHGKLVPITMGSGTRFYTPEMVEKAKELHKPRKSNKK